MRTDSENSGLDRVRHQLRSTGVKNAVARPLLSGLHSRGYLPHVKRENAKYFITFRLGDSLPKDMLLQHESERARQCKAMLESERAGILAEDDQESINRAFRRRIERTLDLGVGACYLGRPAIADLVANALKFFHRRRYHLQEWVVMPNHVHAVIWPCPNHLVGDIVKSWKQFTSLRAKRLLGLAKEGFWQRESFDHWIRDDAEYARIARYIRNNPVKAGLCARPEGWRWSGAWGG
ncbi:MAG TPA: transposase [Verrucomicrobiae bacterium]|jgi:REP element-mobilizing transposase RayT|nr:transposase [Verrucomicrobiae bacterium]